MSDEAIMRRAIALARTAAGWTNPNPLVGAVVVKDGRVIGQGCHERFGQLHAERNALKSCKEDPAGATIYVTLEPCNHTGHQPPCVDALIEAGIAKVVVGSRDPNPLVSGKGNARLRAAGIEVEEDFLRDECDALNPIFFHYITTGKPYIVDGRRRAGESDSEYAVRRRELYATYAAVLAGTESDVPDESFAHFNGPVQAVGADEVVIGGHRPLLLEAGALACTDPDEWLSELGKRKIDSLIVESDEAFERLSMACQKD